MQSNKISATLSQQDREQIMSSINRIKELMPFLINLDKQEILELSKMGDQGRTFAAKALEIVKQNPDIMPRGFDINEFNKDMELFQALEPIRATLMQLLQMVESTKILVGSDAYISSLIVYDQVKNNHLGLALEDAADQLSRRFIHKSKQISAKKSEKPADSGETK